MKHYVLVLMMFLCMAASLDAQIQVMSRAQLESVENPPLSADAANVKFRTEGIVADDMTEDDGIQSFSYVFENVGKDSLRIDRIVTSCSCAVASYKEKTVAPGKEGEIIVKYNPKGHPGNFERKIFVYTGGYKTPSAILRLKVHVENGRDLSGLYPVSMGKIRLRRVNVDFRRGVKAIEKCICVNVSDAPVRLACEQFLLPPFLKFRAQPEMLQPGEEGAMIIEYEPTGREEHNEVMIMLKGLGVPPSQSAIKVKLK